MVFTHVARKSDFCIPMRPTGLSSRLVNLDGAYASEGHNEGLFIELCAAGRVKLTLTGSHRGGGWGLRQANTKLDSCPGGCHRGFSHKTNLMIFWDHAMAEKLRSSGESRNFVGEDESSPPSTLMATVRCVPAAPGLHPVIGFLQHSVTNRGGMFQ